MHIQNHHQVEILKDSKDLPTVVLVSGKAPAPFAENCQMAPNAEGSLEVYVDPKDFKYAQMAGRAIANFGLFNLKLTAKEPLTLGLLDVFYFIQGLYDVRHDLKIALPFLSDENLALLQTLASEILLAREIANLDAQTASPLELAKYFKELLEKAAKESAGTLTSKIEVDGQDPFPYTGLKAVGAGSSEDRKAVMCRFEFIPQGMEASGVDYALVGKGITFDSGGYDLKPPKFMQAMRTDKCGAVYLSFALALALKLGLKKRVVLYVALTDNTVNSQAMKPGDLLTYPNGTTVEIINTDAEGRLILADGLLEATKLNPKVLIDAATLTGAAKNALGRDITAYFCDDLSLCEKAEEYFAANCEALWRLPKPAFMRTYLKGRRSDLKNSTSAEAGAGASTAALFLSHFASNKKEHLHFDLSSAYSQENTQYWVGSMATGATVLSIASILCERKFA